MSQTFGLCLIHVIIVLNLSFVTSAHIPELCSYEHPIDAAVNFVKWTQLIKDSKVWRFSGNDVSSIEGPFQLNDTFPNLEVDSLDAILHIVPDVNVIDADTPKMSWLAFLFKGEYYYIYEYKPTEEYAYYSGTTGVPFNLTPGKGKISLFTGDNRSVDAVLFDRLKYEALFLVENDVFIVSSFKEWSNSKPNVTKSTLNETFGVSDRVDASIDFLYKVMLIFGQTYCDFDWTERKCDKQSLKTYFKCNKSDIIEVVPQNVSTVIDVENTLPKTTTLVPNKEPDLNTENSTEAQAVVKEGKKTPIVLFILIVVVIVIVIISLGCIAFFGFSRKKGPTTDMPSAMNQNSSSVVSKAHKSTKSNPPSTFSEAFGPTPKT